METGVNVRPVQTSSIAPVRQEVAPQRQTVQTELPEAQAVVAIATDEPVRLDLSKNAQFSLDVGEARINDADRANTNVLYTNKVDRDEATKELIFRKVSTETGAVVQQYPDEALLRQRAYRAQENKALLDQSDNKLQTVVS